MGTVIRRGRDCTEISCSPGMAVIMEEGGGEKVTFLGNKINKSPYSRVEEKRSCCFGWSKKKIFCCCCSSLVFVIAAAVIIIYLLLFVFKHGDKSADAAKWEEELAGGDLTANSAGFSMDGTYTLQSYDDQYENYLKAMGIPWYVVPLILAASEKLTVKITGEHADIQTETSWATKEMSFDFGTVFNMTYGRNSGTLWNVCKREAENVMSCRSEEREKGWELLSKMTFSEAGVINERTFVLETGNMVAKKYYKREVEEDVTEDISVEVEISEEEEDDW